MITNTHLLRRLALLGFALTGAVPVGAQHAGHQPPQPAVAPSSSDSAGPADAARDARARGTPAMWMQPIGGGWQLMGMAQVIPTVTTASPWRDGTVLKASGVYATQPAIMADLASPGRRVVLRTTLNVEAWTQRDGEITYGGWGEGFIDSRHPHTLLHEAMLTVNWWQLHGGALSLSAGKGFAPYGTDDPMSRPAVKYPTNHHLSQVLERWTANAAYLRNGWSLEAGLFGGAEPDGPYDLRNIGSFGDSWSARLTTRFGSGVGPAAPWELSASHASITESHDGAAATTRLYNTAVRHAASHGAADVYALLEGSLSNPDEGKGHFSLLGELQLGLGRERRHAPYARVEYASRPEYERLGLPGSAGFFRYDHDSHEIGATRWLATTLGYGYTATGGIVSVRPYAELQHDYVAAARGGIHPRELYGAPSIWSVSVGARVFVGGGPMRMGSYGALDPMTAPMPGMAHGAPGMHGGH